MRSIKATLLVSVLLVLGSGAPADAARAGHPSPSGRHSVSISVSENPIVEGQPIVIYGHLSGPNNAGRQVVLYHRGPYSTQFTPVQQTLTDANGYYAFARLPERVLSNREWYVRSLRARSATVHEHVYAQVTIAASVPAGSTIQTGPRQPVTFSGEVTPASVGQALLLQRQEADGGENWHTIQRARVGAGGHYEIVHEFRFPGDANIRVLLRRDGVNIASPSSVLSYEVEQSENSALTIDSSQNPLITGQSETISGTTSAGEGVTLTLYQRTAGQPLAPIATTTSGSDGSYSFAPQVLVNSTYYEVRTSTTRSALLFVGVKYAIGATTATTTLDEGQPVTLTGNVAPVTPDHVIDLQQLASSGQWVTIQRSWTAADSTFTLTRPLFEVGTVSLRAFIPGGPRNQGAASTPVSVQVIPVMAAQLPENAPSASPATGVAE